MHNTKREFQIEPPKIKDKLKNAATSTTTHQNNEAMKNKNSNDHIRSLTMKEANKYLSNHDILVTEKTSDYRNKKI